MPNDHDISFKEAARWERRARYLHRCAMSLVADMGRRVNEGEPAMVCAADVEVSARQLVSHLSPPEES